MNRKHSTILAALLMTAGLAPVAAHSEPIRVRGAVVSLDGTKLVVHSREGADVAITLADKFGVASVVKASLADIKPGEFIGTASMPQADGSLKGLELQIVPEALRGYGEGHYPWDLQPGSMMTNATVAASVKSVDGETLTLSYKGGEQKVTIPADAPIVSFGPGSAADLKAGAIVFVPGDRKPDGAINAQFVVVGKDGVVPPM